MSMSLSNLLSFMLDFRSGMDELYGVLKFGFQN